MGPIGLRDLEKCKDTKTNILGAEIKQLEVFKQEDGRDRAEAGSVRRSGFEPLTRDVRSSSTWRKWVLYWRRRGFSTPPRCYCQLRGLVDALSSVCDCPPPLSSLALVFLPRRALAGESRAVPACLQAASL